MQAFKPSLSARRAWIEIDIDKKLRDLCESLSARRAWIEILCLILPLRGLGVALRKESVDRNTFSGSDLVYVERRSPQGERG